MYHYALGTVMPETYKAFRKQQLINRINRNLRLFGFNKYQCKLWLTSYNNHLEAIPLDLMKTEDGLIKVDNYLSRIE